MAHYDMEGRRKKGGMKSKKDHRYYGPSADKSGGMKKGMYKMAGMKKKRRKSVRAA